MVRPKGPQRPKKSLQAKKQQPESIEDFQDAADLEEETGGKWRAGDQAKSCRAFLRAVDVYNAGLTRHPKSSDLAYNKARLELELSHQPALVSHLAFSRTDLLRQALTSHRYALRLSEESPDVLFNTAQVMISLAEDINDNAGDISDAIALLREALELLDACFSRQEMLAQEQNIPFDDDVDGGVPLEQNDDNTSPPDTAASDEEETYATVQHPITPVDLLDTARASMNALTILVTLDDPSSLPLLSNMGQTLHTEKIPQCLSRLSQEDQASLQQEIALERLGFIVSLATANYSAGIIDMQTYLSQLQLFEQLDLTSNIASISTYADGLVDFVTSIQSSPAWTSDPSMYQLAWKQLSKAADLYAKGTKLDTDRLGQLYESRGDVEMLRFRLMLLARDSVTSKWRSNAPVLIKNAQTYYKSSVTLYLKARDPSSADKVEIRSMVATVAQGHINGQTEEVVRSAKDTIEARGTGRGVLADMQGEGLLWDGWDRPDHGFGLEDL